MSDLPIYSPTETEDYLICPRYRVFIRNWRARGASWTPHLALGNAIHAGLAVVYESMKTAQAGNYGAANPYAAALGTLETEYQDGSEWTLEGLQAKTEKGLKLALSTELVSSDGRVIAVEEWMNRCRVDLVTREPFGLVVTDHKVVLELEKRRLEYKLRDLDPSWQLLHEAWAARQKFGECPKWTRAHVIVLGPRPFTYLHSVGPLDDRRLDDWERSATDHWAKMEYDWDHYVVVPRLLPPMNTRACSNFYGKKCVFYDGCHNYGGDLAMFPTLYEEGGRE